MFEQIYDEPNFNDKVIRSASSYILDYATDDNDLEEIYNLIDSNCIWLNLGTIIKIKFFLWKGIRNGGAVYSKYYGTQKVRVKDLETAYAIIENTEERFLKEKGFTI